MNLIAVLIVSAIAIPSVAYIIAKTRNYFENRRDSFDKGWLIEFEFDNWVRVNRDKSVNEDKPQELLRRLVGQYYLHYIRYKSQKAKNKVLDYLPHLVDIQTSSFR